MTNKRQEGKKAGRQAIICAQSPRKNKSHPLLGKCNLLKRTYRPNVLTSYRLKKCAFTLAEVLITLGIIGVVAAMTIPTLVANYKKSVVENKLKQAVSIINQAIILSAVDNGTPDIWGITNGQKTTFAQYIQPYMDIGIVCEEKNIDDPKDICNNSVYGSTGAKKSFTNKYILKNGIGLSYNGAPTLTQGQRRGLFIVYLDNGKNKYIYGKNVFPLNLIVHDNQKYLVTGTMDYVQDFSFCSYSKTKLYDLCSNGQSGSSGFSVGIACTALVECNGWKIPDDYPVRL